MARLYTNAQRADGTGDQHFASRGLARFAGDFHAAAVQALHIVAKADGSKLEAVRAKGIRFDDLRACFDVGLMDTENGFRLRGVQLVEAADRTHGFVQQRTHGAIRNENGILQALVKIRYFQSNLAKLSARPNATRYHKRRDYTDSIPTVRQALPPMAAFRAFGLSMNRRSKYRSIHNNHSAIRIGTNPAK